MPSQFIGIYWFNIDLWPTDMISSILGVGVYHQSDMFIVKGHIQIMTWKLKIYLIFMGMKEGNL